jgi:hypothetical protein
VATAAAAAAVTAAQLQPMHLQQLSQHRTRCQQWLVGCNLRRSCLLAAFLSSDWAQHEELRGKRVGPEECSVSFVVCILTGMTCWCGESHGLRVGALLQLTSRRKLL